MPNKRVKIAAALGVAAAVLGWWVVSREAPEEGAPKQAAAAVPQSGSMPFFAAAAVQAAPGAAGTERAVRIAQLKEQLALTDHTYCSYRNNTRYPHSSRPIAEQPDQVYPNKQVTDTHPMRLEGGGVDRAIQIQTSQSRVFMASGETVEFSLRAVDSNGAPQPLVVTRALAKGIVFNGRSTPTVVVPFADDGTGADAVAGDGAFSGALAPAQSALATFNGTVRTIVSYSVNGRAGSVIFDIIYSPELPAVWAGPPREVNENGSLVYVLKANVRTAGRYIVTGRVDDAHGQPFALATFNDLLTTGPQEIRLLVFGKLLHDQKPAMPLTLRDVDGYLLKENVDPDRALMPRLQGRVLTGTSRSPNAYSDAEWQGEERTRYLTEFGKDLQLARSELARLDAGAVENFQTECR